MVLVFVDVIRKVWVFYGCGKVVRVCQVYARREVFC